MESMKENPCLKFRPDTVHFVRKMYDLDKPGRMDEAIDILDDWIKKQNHFTCKEFDKRYLEGIILNSKGSIETAKSRLDKLCTARTMLPDFFLSDVIIENNFSEYAVMPNLTQEGYRVYVHRIRENAVFTDKTLMEILTRVIIDCEYIIKNDYNAGIVGVTDIGSLNLMEVITKIDFSVVRAALSVFREGYGFRIKGLHYVSGSKFLENFIGLVRPALPTKIAKRLNTHKTFETLHNFVPKEVLCKDYGGDAPPLSELHGLRMKQITTEEYLQFLKKISQCRTDESKRIGARPDTDYLPGTFRNLTVD